MTTINEQAGKRRHCDGEEHISAVLGCCLCWISTYLPILPSSSCPNWPCIHFTSSRPPDVCTRKNETVVYQNGQIYNVQTENLYNDMAMGVDRFDILNFLQGHRLFFQHNQPVVVKFKSETAEVSTLEAFISLTAKCTASIRKSLNKNDTFSKTTLKADSISCNPNFKQCGCSVWKMNSVELSPDVDWCQEVSCNLWTT